VDTFLAIASKRDTRHYADRAIPGEIVRRILNAGRLSGSSQNRQPWRFLLVEDAERREQLAAAVYEPSNVRGAQLIVVITGARGLDAGRCVQNMMLAAWNEGVASCPNGIADEGAAKAVLGLEEAPAIVLTFGYPVRHPGAESRSPEEWSARADRKPLDELIEHL
jgi:nitroreductase